MQSKFIKPVLTVISFFLLISCGGSSSGNAGNDTVFDVINSYSVGKLHLLYDRTFSGNISYISSTTDLGITSQDEFNSSTAVKTTASIVADDLIYDDYISISGLSANTAYHIYILNTDTGYLESFTKTTQQNLGSVQETGSIADASGTGTITYNINYPTGYDPAGSTLWPFLLSVKGPNPTSSDNNFPCITFNINISWSNYNQFMTETENLRQAVKSIIENPSYKIDKNRLYATGFSAGGGVVLMIANNDGSEQYQFKALIAVGINDWIDFSGLGNVNTWLFYGETDSYAPDTANANTLIPATGGEHLLTEMPGIGHDSSPVWASPYTWTWLLSK